MSKTIFITATDTGVGKTYIACRLAEYFRRKGFSVGVMKPIATGGRATTGGLISDDAVLLKKHSGCAEPLKKINPYCFKFPLAPYSCGILEKKRINVGRILKAYNEMKNKYDIMIIEGIGGVKVPVKKDYFVEDLVKDMKCPVIIVARLGLGTLNHTILTVESLKKRGIKIAGIILNSKRKAKTIAEKTNPAILKKIYPGINVISHLHGAFIVLEGFCGFS